MSFPHAVSYCIGQRGFVKGHEGDRPGGPLLLRRVRAQRISDCLFSPVLPAPTTFLVHAYQHPAKGVQTACKQDDRDQYTASIPSFVCIRQFLAELNYATGRKNQRRQHRQEDLGGADIAGRLLAPDMLLARLQGHAQRPVARGIDRNADDPAGQLALVRLARREIGGMR
ncbi:hypothetical protein LCGC14_2281240, partial [marine sediment metagenome]